MWIFATTPLLGRLSSMPLEQDWYEYYPNSRSSNAMPMSSPKAIFVSNVLGRGSGRRKGTELSLVVFHRLGDIQRLISLKTSKAAAHSFLTVPRPDSWF